MAKKPLTIYVARGRDYNVVVSGTQKGKKIATIRVPERLSRKVPVERLKTAPGIRRYERRR